MQRGNEVLSSIYIRALCSYVIVHKAVSNVLREIDQEPCGAIIG